MKITRRQLTNLIKENIKIIESQSELEKRQSYKNKSMADILLDQFGDPDKMPASLRMVYDKAREEEAAIAKKEEKIEKAEEDFKEDFKEEYVEEAEELKDTQKNPGVEELNAQHEFIMKKSKEFMKAYEWGLNAAEKLIQKLMKDFAEASSLGEFEAAMVINKNSNRVMQWKLLFQQKSFENMQKGWNDNGESWDVIINMARQLGYQG